jgi:hypothetical protein
MTAYYIPPHITQRDGCPCQFANCWAAGGAWLHRGATEGIAAVSPSEFRRLAGGGSGRANKPGCPSGFEQDVVDGLDALGVKSSIVKVSKADARRLLSTPSRALYGIATDFDTWPDRKDCARGDFDGNHFIGYVPGLPSPSKPVMNPLCGDYQSVALNVVMESAAKFSRDHGRGGQIWMVRVRRPQPPRPSPDPDQSAVIETLREQVAERDEWIARARALITDLAGMDVPG